MLNTTKKLKQGSETPALSGKTHFILLIIFMLITSQAISQSWNLAGNTGTDPAINFIGTTDQKAFKIRTNNAVRITINGSGKVGIGITSPIFKLDVKGGSINTDSVYRIKGNTVLTVNGTANTFVGIKSGFSNTTGDFNTATGDEALYSNTTGDYNTANGSNALHNNTTGYDNTANGNAALYFTTTGVANTASGYRSLYSNTTGEYNTAYGYHSLSSNKAGNEATAVGFNAMRFSNSTTTPFLNTNVAIGYESLMGSPTAANNTGNFNTATGFQSLRNTTSGSSNAAHGYWALASNLTGEKNTAHGHDALYLNNSGNNNVALGFDAGGSQTTGSDCTFLGYSAEAGAPTYSNAIAIGSQATAGASNEVRIGNSTITEIGGYEPWTNVSDGRFKKNISENINGLNFIMKLRPVTYNMEVNKLAAHLKEDEHRDNTGAVIHVEPDAFTQHSRDEKEKILYTGFIAQEVESAAKSIGYDFSGVSVPANNDDLYGLRYSEFVVPLVKAVQELNVENKRLKNENNQLKNDIAEIKAALGLRTKSSERHQQSSDFSFTIIPNPAKESVNIHFINAPVKQLQLVITDATGREVKSIPVSGTETQINTAEFANGTYMVKLTNGNNLVSTQKLFINK